MPPKSKNEVSPPSPSFSHNMMDQISHSFNSRRSSGNNFARFAFNIYGGTNNANNTTNTSPTSNSYQPLANSTSSSNSSHSRGISAFQSYNTSTYNEENNSIKFFSSSEILSFDSSKVDNSIIAIGGQRLLQILKIQPTEPEIVIENDMNYSLQVNRNNKAGAISDLKFGYHQYSHFIAAAATSGNIYLYNLIKSNKIITTLTDHSRTVNTVDFNANQNQSLNHSLMSGSQDGTIKLWDLRSKGTKAVLTIQGASDPVRCVQFSPHVAKKIVGIFDSGVIKKYDLRNPTVHERKMNAHTGPGLTIDWHPEMDYIISGGRDKQIQLWNMSSASNDTRVPEFVMTAPGAVGKVKWSPNSCNGNILESKIATSFFSDDPSVQIWSLNRKYIPEHIIESHLNQVSSILWKDQDTLWSGSKDKSLIQHDLRRCSKCIDNLSPCGVDWSTSNNEMVFIQQGKNNFKTQNLSKPNHAIASHTSEVNLPQSFMSPSPSTTALAFTPLANNSLQSFERPNLNRSATHRPQLVRNLSNQHANPLQVNIKPSPYVFPLTLPLRDSDPQIFDFLSSHYLTSVPEGMDFTSVCEYNAMISANAKQFRESQTWRVIKASVLWQYEQGPNYAEDAKKSKTIKHQAFPSNRSITNSRTNSELDVGSLGSHSTGHYFEISSNNNSMTPLPRSANLTPPSHSKEHLSFQHENLAVDAPRAFEGLRLSATDSREKEATKEEATEDDRMNKIVSPKEESSQPIAIKPPSKKRSSFNGFPNESIPYTFNGSNPDYDDETRGYASSSAGKSPMSLRSSISPQRHEAIVSANTWKTIANSKTQQFSISRSNSRKSLRSGRSVLSKVLQEEKLHSHEEAIVNESDEEEEELDEQESKELLPPWTPEVLIKEAAEYSAHQGNVIMCATLALLFAPYFKKNSITRYQAMDWIYTYHEILLRKQLFTEAADVLRNASNLYPVMKQKGQTETFLRFYCFNCKELIVNEASKEKIARDPEVDFGYWYCDNCKKINGNCCYCNELIKGMTIASMPCGHIAHFGCYRSWFFVEEEKCCPACAYPILN